MKHYTFAFILFTVFLISSCDSSKEETNSGNEEPADVELTETESDDLKEMKERQDHGKANIDANASSKDESPTSETKIDPLDVPVKITNFDLLQGKWQHTEDRNNTLIFDGNVREEFYTGSAQSSKEVFILSNTCKNTSNSQNSIPLSENSYISCVKSDLCWFIIELDEEHLSLGYMGRGNTLTYKRIK